MFDYSKHGSCPTDSVCRPQYKCLGHEAEGYGLAWNPHQAGQLLSGSDDAKICLWDINNNHSGGDKSTGIEVQPMATYKGHDDVVEDVDFHKHMDHCFGSVGDDSKLLLWDAREVGSDAKPTQAIQNAHDGDVNCISFNPYNEFLVATGGSDSVVHLWDLRKFTKPMHVLEGHTGGVFQVSWAPHNETILGSCSADRRVHIWDLAKIGEEQDPEDAEDGPPELLFIHGGHTSKVSDFSWNATDHWAIASVADDNILQVWQMVRFEMYFWFILVY